MKQLFFKYYKDLFIIVLTFLSFLIPYLDQNGIAYLGDSSLIIQCKDLAYATLIAVILVLSKNTFFPIALLMSYPFTIGYQFSVDNTPISIIFSGIIVFFGMIIHLVLYKPKFKFGKYTLGLFIYGLFLSLGGIFSKSCEDYPLVMYKPIQTLLILVVVFLVVFICIFVSSTIKINFDSLCNFFIDLSIVIILEEMTFLIFYDKFLLDYFVFKPLNLGWGIHNNVGLILLMCLPFILYKSSKNQRFNLTFIIYYFVVLFAIIITLSKGAIFISIISSIFMWIYFLTKTKFKKTFFLHTLSIFLTIILAMGIIFIIKKDWIIFLLKQLNFTTISARFKLYKSAFNVFLSNPFFGVGLFGGLGWNMENVSFQFVHNTFLQMIFSSGIFGLLALLYHLVEKYYNLLHQKNPFLFVIFLSVLLPGIYGMIDVTYLYVNYFICMFILLCISQNIEELSNSKYEWGEVCVLW